MVERLSDSALAMELVRHEAWLRRALLRWIGPHDVDDVLQDTWLALLRSPPRGAGTLRAVLLVASRRRALKISHSEQRRRHREHEAARPIAVAEPPVHSEPARRVTTAVRDLAEPYRSTLHMRFYAGLSAREIAARFAVPEATVRTRLRRGLGQLAALLRG